MKQRGIYKLGRYEIIDNSKGEYAVVNIQKRVRDIWIKGDNEAAYAAYRVLTGADNKTARAVVKPLIKNWEGGK